MKTTIRENILFGETYRPRRYEKVLVACALKEDLRCLPDGDLTEIGTNSINLSGGQKSRITIARALYSSANVVIMVLKSSKKKITQNRIIEASCTSYVTVFTFIFILYLFYAIDFPPV